MASGNYCLLSYRDERDKPRAGILVNERWVVDVVDILSADLPSNLLNDVNGIAMADFYHSVAVILQDWTVMHRVLRQIARGFEEEALAVGDAKAVDNIELLAPVLPPGTIFCAGANYRDHVDEMSRAMNLPQEPDPHELGLKPWHFIKPATSAVGPNQHIPLPAYSQKVDWEAEIAVVIGREARNVPIEQAMDYVAGYTIVNDLSARDFVKRTGVADDSPFRYDWLSHKSFDGSCPMGPWIAPADQIADPSDMKIRLWVNDELMQDSSSSQLIFSMAEQISHLSTRVTLRSGDIIATGTPAGVGMARGRFLEPGDVVRIWVEGIGELVNTVAAPL